MLAARAPALAAELLPAGKRHGAEWRCGSVAGEPGASMSVRLFGSRAGVWSDFAAGQGGDALDLVAAVRYGGDIRQAMAWARGWLGLSDTSAAPAMRRDSPPPEANVVDPTAQERQAAAQRIFLGARPSLAGTPAADYLAGRAIDLAELGRQPNALRFHDRLFNAESGRYWPGLVAAISGPEGALQAVHRIWLGRQGGQWTKAPLRTPKASLGPVAGGFIPLWRGASGKPFGQAPAGDTVAIGEGIETCLSVAISCPELRVISAVSLGNLARLTLPAALSDIILLKDVDGDNPQAARAFQRAIDRFLSEGRRVRIAEPETPHKDWNDVLAGRAA